MENKENYIIEATNLARLFRENFKNYGKDVEYLTKSGPIIKMKNYLFSSESVTEGHPDKVCDQISDAILDALLEQDENSRVACETMITTGWVIVSS